MQRIWILSIPPSTSTVYPDVRDYGGHPALKAFIYMEGGCVNMTEAPRIYRLFPWVKEVSKESPFSVLLVLCCVVVLS